MRVVDEDYMNFESPRSHIPRARQFDVFKQEYGDPEKVWHPGPGDDLSASDVFSNVLHSDRNSNVIEMLENQGLEGKKEDIMDADHGPYDLVIWINFPVEGISDVTERNIEEGGYVVANSYVKDAEEFDRNRNFRGVGKLEYSDEAHLTEFDTPECPGWEKARKNEGPLWIFEYDSTN